MLINWNLPILDQYNGGRGQTRICTFLSTDNYQTITDPKYLNINMPLSNPENALYANDIIFMTYSGGQAMFQPSIAADGSVTLLPVVNNFVRFDSVASFSALASGASVVLLAGEGSAQFKIINLWINSGGVNFDSGGNRDLIITDGTTVYSDIPAVELKTISFTNTMWGLNTTLPFPAAAPINTSTAAGASLVAKYSGGTTDYVAGFVPISGLLQRVA